jgi:hypothetical protein
MPMIRIKRKQTPAGGETLKPGELGVMGDYLYYGNRGANDESDNTPIQLARVVDVFPVNATAYHVLAAPASNGAGAWRAITKDYVGLSNVTNHAQIKKQASTTTVGNIPTWGVTTGDELGLGYGVKTSVEGAWNNTDLVRADVIKSYLDAFLTANDAMVYKGTLGSGGTFTAIPTIYSAGHTMRVITAGTYAGHVCEIGDMITAIVSRPTGSGVNADWTVLQSNLDGAVIGPASVGASGNIPTFSGTSGKIIADGYGVQTTLSTSTTHLVRADAIVNALSGKQNTITGAATTIVTNDLTVSRVLISNASGKVEASSVTTTTLSYLDASSSIQTQLNGKAASNHQHGNITNDGKVGSTANLPLITTIDGAITVGSFGTAANTFCQGNDSRLTDTRDPKNHTLIGSHHTVSGLTTGHFLKATGATTYGFSAHGLTAADVSAVPTTRTVNSKALSANITLDAGDVGAASNTHEHGNITNDGRIASTTAIANGDSLIIGNAIGNGVLVKSSLLFATTHSSEFLRKDGTWVVPYTHPTTDGNKHLPSGGASGNILIWASAGTASWSATLDAGTWA